jgi:hypothetical protein
MLQQRGVLDDLITLAECRDVDPATAKPQQSGMDAGPASSGLADDMVALSPASLAPPSEPLAIGGGPATPAASPSAFPAAGLAYLDGLATSAMAGAAYYSHEAGRADSRDAPLSNVTLAAGTIPRPSDSFVAPSAGSPGTGISTQALAAGPVATAQPEFSMADLATTQPQLIDFTASALPAFGADASFSFSLPSFLYQSFSYSTGVSFAGFGLNAGVSVSGGVKGSVALSLGQFTPDYPVTIDPGVIPFIQDGQVFSIDPSLISTNDAQFSLSLPQANASLDFGLQAKAGVTLSFPTIPIGFSLPFVGFIGYRIHIPSQFFGFQGGTLYKLPSSTSIMIPGDGTVTLSELQASTVSSGTQSAYEGLPTLEASGSTAPFFAADIDLVALLAEKVPDPFAALSFSTSIADGAASLSYKLFSLVPSISLYLGESTTVTPIGITESVTDTLTGQTQTGTIGQSFNFTAPSSGNGVIPLSITFGLELSIHTELDLDGSVTLALEGPQLSASVLGLGGSIGPVGNFNLFSLNGKLFQLYSNTFTETLTETTTVDVQNFAHAVTKTVSGKSGGVNITQPATDLLVSASGTVTGGAFGVQTGTLSAAMVTDYGLISATGSGIDLRQGGSVDVEAGGRVTGRGSTTGTGILAMGAATDAVINTGAITGFSQGVILAGGELKNESQGLITATSLGVSIANPDAQIVNNGSIGAATAVSLADGGSLYNAQSGTITGGAYGVYAGGMLSVENHCTLTGGTDGVHALAAATVTNDAGAFIHGGAVGVILDGGDTANEMVTNGVGGTITGAKVGVSLYGANTTLVDSGLISGSLTAISLYGTESNTLTLDPDAKVLGGVRMSSVANTINLMAGSGEVGTLAGLGTVLPIEGTIAIADGASWNISGNLDNVTLNGLSATDTLNDTGIAYSAGERAVFDYYTHVLSFRAAGAPTVSIGTIQVDGRLINSPSVTKGAAGGVDVSFSAQPRSSVSANNGEVYIAPTGLFGPSVTVGKGVVVSSTYYGAYTQSFGVLAAQERASLTNFGTILGTDAAVDLTSGGVVRNEAGGLISGAEGISLGSNSPDLADTVAVYNAGTVTAQTGGVYLNTLGTVSNLTTGVINAANLNGVQLDAGGSVSNQGTIEGGRSAVRLFGVGFIYNEASGLMAGGNLFGVEITGGYGKVANCGTISSAKEAGVSLGDGGFVVNETGSITGATLGVQITGTTGNIANGAYIQGVQLVYGGEIINGVTGVIGGQGVLGAKASAGPLAITNIGTISGAVTGVAFTGAGVLANGNATHGTSLIKGKLGVDVAAHRAVTLTNFGVIEGTGGTAVRFRTASDRLIAEAGSTWLGMVDGGGGALELAGGTGTITGLGGAGLLMGAETMSFSGFGSYAIDAGGSWMLAGTDSLAADATLSVAGTLTLSGALTNGGVLAGATGSKIVLKKGDLAGGTLSSAGSVLISSSGNILDGSKAALTNQATITLANNSALTLQGAIINSGTIALAGTKNATSLVIGKAGVTLSGAGSVVLGAGAFNTLTGAATTATLTNLNNTISGSGLIGAAKMVLVNAAAGTIVQTGSTALTINTGTQTIINAGTIEATGAGGLTVSSAMTNTGVLEAMGGVLTLGGMVTGTGGAVVAGGRLDFTAGNSFTGGTTLKSGVLELAAAKAAGTGVITFAPGATGVATLQLDSAATPFTKGVATVANTLVNFGTNSFIDIAGMTYAAGATVSLKGKVMTVSSDGQTLNFTLAGALPSLLLVVANAGGGLQINTEGISTQYELNAAVQAADQTGAGPVKLLICSDIRLNKALAPIDLKSGVTLDLEGEGYAVGGAGAGQGLTVSSGMVTLENLRFGGPLSVAAGCGVSGYGAVGGAVVNDGVLEAEGGVLTVQGPVSGRGEVVIGAGATALFSGAVSQEIKFVTDAGATLRLASPALVTGQIRGFDVGDTIDLAGVEATSIRRVGAAYSIYDGARLVATLDLAVPADPEVLSLADDGAGGVDIIAKPVTQVGDSAPTSPAVILFQQFTAGHLDAPPNWGEHLTPAPSLVTHLPMLATP